MRTPAGATAGIAAATHRLSALPVLAVVLLLSACTTFNDGFSRVDRQLIAGDLAAARTTHEKLTYPPRDHALQLLNRAMLLRFGNDLSGANLALEDAKTLIEELAKLSLSEQASSLITNDERRAYEGQVHERIYLHLIKVINHWQLGDRSAARVEVLQLDVLMRDLAIGEPAAVERAAPFAHYLSGLLYDALGERSDAMIAFRQAEMAYRVRAWGTRGASAVPAALPSDLLRLTRQFGLSEENNAYRKAYGQSAALVGSPNAGEGELLVLVFDGLAPGLRENSVMWADPLSGRLLRLSLPAVADRHFSASPPKLRVGSRLVTGELADDVDRLVRADLDARKPAMAGRALARQAIKQGAATAVTKAAQRKADNSGEQVAVGLLSIGLQFASALSERADTRNWSTLPGRIWLLRLPLAVGVHRVQLEFDGRTQTLSDLRVAAGEKTFAVWHPLGPSGLLAATE